MSQSTSSKPKPQQGTARPGGRTERTKQAVAESVLSELSEGNFSFSVSQIADKAGINRSTVYRRWPNRATLLHEGLLLNTSNLKAPDYGDWEKDLRALAKELAKFTSNPIEVAINRALASSSDPELVALIVEYWTPLARQLAQPIINAQDRGDISKDLDPMTLFSLLLSPMMMAVVLTHEPLSSTKLENVILSILMLTK